MSGIVPCIVDAPIRVMMARRSTPRIPRQRHGQGRTALGIVCLMTVTIAVLCRSRLPGRAFAPTAETNAQVGFFTQSFYHASLLPLLALTLLLAWAARPSANEPAPAGFWRYQCTYLAGWCLCVGADWLQGPYVYALYAAYGFSGRQIAQLFIAGFGASMVSGCVIGTMADRFGRKKTCLAYCLFYILSCLTKHCNHYWILMLGRLTGGVATSMLFSAFECWMVSEHTVRHGFSGGLLGYMFGMMFSLMYLVAIVCGFLAQIVVDSFAFSPISEGSMIHVGGYLGPFDMSIGLLLVGFVIIAVFWNENFGEAQSNGDTAGLLSNIKVACNLLVADVRILLVGVAAAAFEGAMYAFVFNWTPALDSKDIPPPHGLIFAAFMMACMCGASFSTFVGGSAKPYMTLQLVFCAGALSLGIAAFAATQHNLGLCFACFLLFEFCVGVYFPVIGVLKSNVVPERVRTTMYNLYRMPLNAVVVGLLLSDTSSAQCFGICALLIFVALICTVGIALRERK